MKLSSIIWKCIGFIGEAVGYLKGYNPAPWAKRPKNPLYSHYWIHEPTGDVYRFLPSWADTKDFRIIWMDESGNVEK